MTSLEDIVEQITGQRPTSLTKLAGGSVGDVCRLDFADGSRIVAKLGEDGSNLNIEGRMLAYLRDNSQLPVPEVLFAAENLLLLEFIEGENAQGDAPEMHAADLLAALHNLTAENFGLEFDTLIGGLHQPNPPTKSWLEFFRDQRLLYMAAQARDAGKLPGDIYDRVEKLGSRLAEFLPATSKPSLILGDLWGGNIMAKDNHVSAFIDPAIYYADAEIELAFSTLFNTFDKLFFTCYQMHRPLEPDFFEVRRDIYNLYPLLVHVHLFGGSYVGSVDMVLKKFGV
ncbi:MAG: phosphotransferase [Alphaproteobacteria bacterium]|nr:phosphotransferase [Alphaproteobacteria bacterium]